jgi:O-antigen/teichoic acid export membrane protein
MQRKFFTNLSFLFFLNIIVKPVWIFGIDRTVQNTVGAQNYGLYFALFNLSLVINVVLDLGITNFNNTTIAQNPHLLGKYLPNVLTLKIMLSFIYMAATLIIGLCLGIYGIQLYLLFLLLLNQVLISMVLYLRSNISALHLFRMDSIISVSDKIITIIICSWLLLTITLRRHFTVEWYIYAQNISLLIILIVCLIIVRSKSPVFGLKFDLVFLRLIIKQSYPFAILILLMTAYTRIDGIMVKSLLGQNGDREAGIYASAYRLLDAFNQFGYLFAALLLPIFARMLRQKSPIEQLVKLSFTAIFILSSVAALTIYFSRDNIMHLLYKDSSVYSASILGYLIFCFICTGTVYVFGTLLTANGNLMKLSGIALVGVVFNFNLNYILIPRYQAEGAAIAAIITQVIVAALHIILAVNIFKLKPNFKLIALLIIYFLLCATIDYYAYHLLTIDWKINFILCGAINLLIAFILGLIDIKRVIELVRNPAF